MRSNTPTRDLPLKLQSTEEVERQFINIQHILSCESFGSDDEARYDLMEERSRLFKELKRRRAMGH